MNRNYSWKYYLVLGGAILSLLFIHIFLMDTPIRQKKQKQESELPNIAIEEESSLEKNIRVLITTEGFSEITHNQVRLKAKNGLVVVAGTERMELSPGEIFDCKPDNALFRNKVITITPAVESDRIKIASLKRGCGIPSYAGKMELYATAEGIVIINDLPVEEYLCGVVPSEMPSSYEKEALKCQAICARSYAYCQMKSFAYPEYKAHVDDSTSYQVYGNSKRQKATNQAVKSTKGLTVQYNGKTVVTYYFSTSAGHTTSVEAWGTKLTQKNQYLQGVDICDNTGKAYEKELPWYRWSICISKEKLANLLELNTGVELGELTEICIAERGVGDVALKMEIVGSEGSITIETENKIRKALGNGDYEIVKQDGSIISATTLLPSAFIDIFYEDGNYHIEGGGFGHGIGMSQNGANEMAKAGINYKEILSLFYPGCSIE